MQKTFFDSAEYFMKLEAEMHERALSDQVKIDEYARYLESVGAPKTKTPLLCREVVAVDSRSKFLTQESTSGTKSSLKKTSSSGLKSSRTPPAAPSPPTHPKSSSLDRSNAAG